jgi:hypothetical protein
MIEIFKTNVDTVRQAETILALLHHHFPFAEVNFDLEDCDKILRVKGENFCSSCIVRILVIKGFECLALE